MPTSPIIRLRDVRASFLFIDKPKAFKGSEGPGKFQGTFLLDPKREAHAAQIAEIKQLSKDICNTQWPKGVKLSGKCWEQHGDEDVYDGWQNMFSVAASESERPAVRSIRGLPVSPGEPGFPYSGCYVDVWVSLWTQDNQFGKRVNANLLAVQMRRDGPAFSNRPNANNFDFDDFSSEVSDDFEDEFDPLGD